MNVYALSEKLKQYHPEIILNHSELTAIQDVEICHKNQSLFEPGILYLLALSADATLYPEFVSDCFFCLLNDPTAPEEEIGFAKGNFIILQSSNDLAYVYQEIQITLKEYDLHIHNIEALNSLLFENKGLQDILNTGCALFGNPLILEDSFSNLIAASAQWEENLHGRLQLPKFDRLSSNVAVNYKIIAKLSVIGKYRSFKESDYELVPLLSKIISYELLKEDFSGNSQGLTYEFLMLDLIEGRLKDPLVIEERVRKCKWRLKETLSILAVHSNGQATGTLPHFVRDSLQDIVPSSKSVIYNDYIILVMTQSDEIPLSKEVAANLEKFLKIHHLQCGLSRCFQQLQEISDYYLQALKALELGLRIDKEKTLYDYEDYAVFHMLDICSRQKDLKDFCHPSLLQLMEYDRRNHTLYTFSLYVYLKHKGNHKDTADELHISQSTLVYRMTKIKNIIKNDLNDEEYHFQLLLTYKILEYTSELTAISEADKNSV